MKHPEALLLIAQMLAFHRVWRWYVERLTDGSDEPWGLVALGTALLVCVRAQSGQVSQPRDLIVPALLTLAYAAAYPFVPRLVQAGIAVTAFSCTLSMLQQGRRLHIPTLGLLILSLPVVPSLQFFLGYPMRVISGAMAALLLQMGGLAVVREGTCLRWGGELISIDAPCSGIRMLWAGLYCAFAVSALFRLSSRATLVVTAFAAIGILLGNVLRSTALFYLEARILVMPPWCHEAAGSVAFFSVSAITVWIAKRIGEGESCAFQASF